VRTGGIAGGGVRVEQAHRALHLHRLADNELARRPAPRRAPANPRRAAPRAGQGPAVGGRPAGEWGLWGAGRRCVASRTAAAALLALTRLRSTAMAQSALDGTLESARRRCSRNLPSCPHHRRERRFQRCSKRRTRSPAFHPVHRKRARWRKFSRRRCASSPGSGL
jgi:hypothetical protein